MNIYKFLLVYVFSWIVVILSCKPQEKMSPIHVKEVVSIGFTVSNLEKSISFFERALGFKKVKEFKVSNVEHSVLTGVYGSEVNIARLKLGNQTLELTEYKNPKGRPYPVVSNSNDLWFQHIAIVVSDMDKAYNHLRQFSYLSISQKPQTIPKENKNAAGIRAFKFKDMDGHPLELLYFPPGKGKPIWQNSVESVFLGIDHTAISIRDTEDSLGFYRDILGFKVLGSGTNTGITQDMLDNLSGVKVFITGLGILSDGIGLEFLDYKTPKRNHNENFEISLNDLYAWQITLEVSDIQKVYHFLKTQKRVSIVSSRIAFFQENTDLGFRKSFIIKDTNGHLLRIIQK